MGNTNRKENLTTKHAKNAKIFFLCVLRVLGGETF
jgi:hypothetical protein